MAEQSSGFRAKVLNSAKLSTIRFASDVGLRLVSTVVLTRLLSPEIYGVFAIVLVYLYLLEMFSDFGIRSLILTKEGETDDGFLRSCWTASIVRGAIIAFVSSLIAFTIWALQERAVFAADNPYSAQELPGAIVVLGATAILIGLQSPMRYVKERQMDFGWVTVVHVTVNVVGLASTIILAIYLRSIWALVLGNVLKAATQVLLSFLLFPGPSMRLQMTRKHLDIIVGRGKWIIGHSILTALAQSSDRLMLGFVMTSSTFGFYFIARQLVDIVSKFLRSLDGQISLQVFSHLHKSTAEQFQRNYYRYRLFFDAIAGLSTGALYATTPLLISIIFDDRYAGVAPIVQILIWGLLLIGPLLLRSAFSAERRFREMTLLSLVSVAMLWIGLGIAIFGFDSIQVALLVIALHRLPEAMIIMLLGGDRGWVLIWREFFSFVFCIAGVLLGWAALWLWGIVT